MEEASDLSAVLKRKLLEKLVLIDNLLDDYEKKYKEKTGKSAVAVLLTYYEGYYGFASIIREHVEDLYSYLKRLKKEKATDKVDEVHVILHSPGGDGDAAYQMSRILHRFGQELRTRVIYIIPRFAKSAATLMALGGSEIRMTEIAELGPIDPQVNFQGDYISAIVVKSSMTGMLEAMLEAMYKFVEKDTNRDELAQEVLRETVVVMVESVVKRFIGIGKYESLVEYSKRVADDLLSLSMFSEESERRGESRLNVDRIVDALARSYPSHEMVIDYQSASKLGLKVSKVDDELEDLLLEIYKTYHGLFEDLDYYWMRERPRVRPYLWRVRGIRHGMIVAPWPRELDLSLNQSNSASSSNTSAPSLEQPSTSGA